MGVLLDRLINYSLKKDKWHKTQAGAHHKHKGTQPGSKKKALKSYERHCLQKESGILTSTLATIEQLRKDTHTKAEKIACLETARQYQLCYTMPPYTTQLFLCLGQYQQQGGYSCVVDTTTVTAQWSMEWDYCHDTNKPSTHHSGLPNANVYATNFFATA
uniref:Uncharacterized protein n=1 Tax=Moniliophthora roreri TaxID=221103 RepID=A0A0W0FSG7_MONRR